MNNLETIVKLIDAGYTKAEIDAMLTPSAPAQEQTAPAPAAPAQEQEQTAPAAPAQEQTAPASPAAPAAPAGSGDILEAINKLTQTIVMHNINTQGVVTQPQRTAEDALAEIIAPPGAQRNNLGR